MKKIEIENYKGVRDFYPNEMFIQDYINSVWHAVLQSYGYEHYSASILEYSELYEGKTSNEIVSEQTYNFTDRGGRRITLRPEMTPTVTRMVAKKQKSLSFPLRWYSIPNVFRYERPQKGRLREHWQLNVDIFGLDNVYAELEIIEIAYDIMHKFGLTEKDFVIKINDRKIIQSIIKDLKLDSQKEFEFKKLLDKKDKIADFNDQMFKIIGKPFDQTISPNSLINKIIDKLNKRNIFNVVFEPLLIRGFDYYTDLVFEIYDTNPENSRSLFGGGRYDNLLDVYGGQKIGTVGFGMGDVTIKESLQIRNLLPQKISPAHIYIGTLDDSYFDFACNLAKQIRADGVDVVVNYEKRKISDQIKKAEKLKIPFFIAVGEEEIQNKNFKMKNMKNGSEKKITAEQVAEFVKNNILN
ncbi:MAG TPA: histidine--tRNA ligase [Candidatus Paceibacterota bacterium]|nr:histidine--tRNA ligase [Candidatus Paceibacterota bacterium]